MSADKYYVQCKFQSLTRVTYGWIEERYAKRGSIVSFKDSPHIRWEIVDVGSERITKKKADEQGRAHLHHREYSDI